MNHIRALAALTGAGLQRRLGQGPLFNVLRGTTWPGKHISAYQWAILFVCSLSQDRSGRLLGGNKRHHGGWFLFEGRAPRRLYIAWHQGVVYVHGGSAYVCLQGFEGLYIGLIGFII